MTFRDLDGTTPCQPDPVGDPGLLSSGVVRFTITGIGAVPIGDVPGFGGRSLSVGLRFDNQTDRYGDGESDTLNGGFVFTINTDGSGRLESDPSFRDRYQAPGFDITYTISELDLTWTVDAQGVETANGGTRFTQSDIGFADVTLQDVEADPSLCPDDNTGGVATFTAGDQTLTVAFDQDYTNPANCGWATVTVDGTTTLVDLNANL